MGEVSYAYQYMPPVTGPRKIADALSRFTEAVVHEDRSVEYIVRQDSRFLEAECWTVGMFRDIGQFKENNGLDFRCDKRILRFNFPNETINNEVRFIVYHKLFRSDWSVSNLFTNRLFELSLSTRFLWEKYPRLGSLLDLDIGIVSDEWINWLERRGVGTLKTTKEIEWAIARHGQNSRQMNGRALFLPNLCKWLKLFLDDREEWEKDGWDVRNLERYGVSYNKASFSYHIQFGTIDPPALRLQLKSQYSSCCWIVAVNNCLCRRRF